MHLRVNDVVMSLLVSINITRVVQVVKKSTYNEMKNELLTYIVALDSDTFFERCL